MPGPRCGPCASPTARMRSTTARSRATSSANMPICRRPSRRKKQCAAKRRKRMKAAVLFEAKTPLSIEDVTVSKPGPHEVLIRTVAVGVCRSDLHFVDGAYPHALPTIPGHEAAGVVEAIGDEVSTVKVGDHVVTCLSAFCGHCEHCVTGHMSLCVDASVRRPKTGPQRLMMGDQIVHQML